MYNNDQIVAAIIIGAVFGHILTMCFGIILQTYENEDDE